MKPRDFFFSNVAPVFFVVTTCVTLAFALLGLLIPGQPQSYWGPLAIGAASALSTWMLYSPRELTVAQTVVRKGLHLLVIEGMVLGMNCLVGAALSGGKAAVVALTVPAVYLLVNLVLWAGELRTSRALERSLKAFQKRGGVRWKKD